MADEHIAEAAPIPSFLLECLAYNVPNTTLRLDTYTATMRNSLFHLYDGTKTPQACVSWKEVNEQKGLFTAAQAWTPQQVNSFVVAAWNYIGFQQPWKT